MSAPDEAWWERTFGERQRALEDHYGVGVDGAGRPGYVLAFPPALRLAVPGGCVLSCPPDTERPGARPDAWLLATLGLSQPLEPRDVVRGPDGAPGRSGRGYELALEVASPRPWAGLTLALLAELALQETSLDRGHRVGFFLGHGRDGEVLPFLGSPEQHEGVERVGTAAALLLWPDLRGDVFCTETGAFYVLAATAVTEREWALAQETSTEHVLLLLSLAGVGQRCDPFRADVTGDPHMQQAWQAIAALPAEEVADQLWDRSSG